MRVIVIWRVLNSSNSSHPASVRVPIRHGGTNLIRWSASWTARHAFALEVLSDGVIRQVQTAPPDDRHNRDERDRLYFEAMMRVLDRENPGYAD